MHGPDAMKVPAPRFIIDSDPDRPIIYNDPDAPKPMSKAWRLACFLISSVLLGCALVAFLAAADGPKRGLMLMAAFGFAIGGVVLLSSALFPNFSLARVRRDGAEN